MWGFKSSRNTLPWLGKLSSQVGDKPSTNGWPQRSWACIILPPGSGGFRPLPGEYRPPSFAPVPHFRGHPCLFAKITQIPYFFVFPNFRKVGKFQACREYKICHPYSYSPIFRGYSWIYPWICMDISIFTDAYRASTATKVLRNTAVPEHPFPQALFCETVKNK